MPASFLAMDWPLELGHASFCLPSGAFTSFCTLVPVVHPSLEGAEVSSLPGSLVLLPHCSFSRERMAFFFLLFLSLRCLLICEKYQLSMNIMILPFLFLCFPPSLNKENCSGLGGPGCPCPPCLCSQSEGFLLSQVFFGPFPHLFPFPNTA